MTGILGYASQRAIEKSKLGARPPSSATVLFLSFITLTCLVWVVSTSDSIAIRTASFASIAPAQPYPRFPGFCQVPRYDVSESDLSYFTSFMSVDRSTWGAFMGARLQCVHSTLRYAGIPTHTPLCVHAAEGDTTFSARVLETGMSISQQDYDFMRKLGPCSASRSVFVDVGAGVGSVSILAGLQHCQIIAFEPSSMNVGRLIRNLKDNKLMRNASVYRNVVLPRHGSVFVHWLETAPSAAYVNGTQHGNEQIYSVWLDDFFLYPARPSLVSQPARSVSARDIAVLWIDSGIDTLQSLHTAAFTIQIGRIPTVVLNIPLYMILAPDQGVCQARQAFSFLRTCGYTAFFEGKRVNFHDLWNIASDTITQSNVPNNLDEEYDTTGQRAAFVAQLESMLVWFILGE